MLLRLWLKLEIIHAYDLNFAKYYYFHFAYRGVLCKNSFITQQVTMYYWNPSQKCLPKATRNNSSRKKKNSRELDYEFLNFIWRIFIINLNIYSCDLIKITYQHSIKFGPLSGHENIEYGFIEKETHETKMCVTKNMSTNLWF